MLASGDSRGKISPCGFLALLLLVSGVYLGYKLGPPWYAYYALKDSMEGQVKLAMGLREDEIRRSLAARARELGVPLEEQDFLIVRRGSRVRIRAQWSTTVEFPLDYSHTFHFKIEAGSP